MLLSLRCMHALFLPASWLGGLLIERSLERKSK